MIDFDGDADIRAIPFKALRAPWHDEPEVDIHQTDEHVVRRHPDYADAKAGDGEAAVRLVDATINPVVVEALGQRSRRAEPILLPVVAEESEGANAIPLALAQRLSLELGWEVEMAIIQSNVAARTRKDGYYRLAVQPVFDGIVDVHQPFLLVDDFVGQGATLATCVAISWVSADGWRASRHLRVSGFPVGLHCGQIPWPN